MAYKEMKALNFQGDIVEYLQYVALDYFYTSVIETMTNFLKNPDRTSIQACFATMDYLIKSQLACSIITMRSSVVPLQKMVGMPVNLFMTFGLMLTRLIQIKKLLAGVDTGGIVKEESLEKLHSEGLEPLTEHYLQYYAVTPGFDPSFQSSSANSLSTPNYSLISPKSSITSISTSLSSPSQSEDSKEAKRSGASSKDDPSGSSKKAPSGASKKGRRTTRPNVKSQSAD